MSMSMSRLIEMRTVKIIALSRSYRPKQEPEIMHFARNWLALRGEWRSVDWKTLDESTMETIFSDLLKHLIPIVLRMTCLGKSHATIRGQPLESEEGFCRCCIPEQSSRNAS
jgi:hypothetical protein